MTTFEVRKSWLETKYRMPSVSVTVEAESKEEAIERAETLLDGARPTRQGEWVWGDDTILSGTQPEADWDNDAAANKAEWEVEEL